MGTVSADGYYTGTRAALAGGTTMLMDFAIPAPKGSHLEQYKAYRARADPEVTSDYGIHVGIVHWNDEVAKEMEVLVKEHGVNSFKVFMAYKGAFMLSDSDIYQVMKKAKELGAIVQVHAENGELVVEGQERIFNLGITGPEGHGLSRPAYVEGEATKRIATLAWAAGNVPLYVVHVMSQDAMDEVRRAKERGQRIVGEPIIAGLTLDDSHTYNKDWDYASRYVMSPPLRPKGHQEPLLRGLKSGILDILGTDHCSFSTEQKRMGREDFRKIPNGIASVEHRMNLLWQFVREGRLTPQEFVRATSARAAQVFNIYPRKGLIQEGSDADIAIIDPEAKQVISAKTHHHNVEHSAYEGKELEGVVTVTISRGKVVYENGKLNIEKGAGVFVETPAFSPYLYEGLERENVNFHTPKKVERAN
mmetsp:Transcript_2682/g.10300  ORF Transcript_2682/g.10300 Transcript_2682/m.10300 type:complete len:419 (+) Transcript_2682:263-1519(+)